jgi:tetratricopeptide (TPR) repeat protein
MKLLNYDGALKDFNRAIIIGTKNDPAVYIGRGLAFLMLKNQINAMEDLEKAVKLGPENAEAYSARAYARMQKWRYSEAIEDFNKAVGLDQGDYNNYYLRAIAEAGTLEYEGAFKDCARALELKPPGPVQALIYHNRSVMKRRYGDVVGAMEDRELAAHAGYDAFHIVKDDRDGFEKLIDKHLNSY